MKRVVFDEKKINERIQQGYGQGEGKDYTPWLVVGDFSSDGQCNRVLGTKTGRLHDFFSKLESNYFNFLDWQDEVIDIREQVPLFPVCETEAIAASVGVKHPYNNKLKISCVMTTDFLFSIKSGGKITFHARSVKYVKDLENGRTQEKMSIEREYWESRGVEFDVITENSIDQEKCASLRRFLDHYTFPLSGIMEEKNADIYASILINKILQNDGRLSSVLQQFDMEHEFPTGSTLSFFYHLVARKIIPINFEGKFLPSKNINKLIDLPLLILQREMGALEHGTSC